MKPDAKHAAVTTAIVTHDRIDADTYHRDIVPGLLAGAAGRLASDALDALPELARLSPLVVRVGDTAWTYRPASTGGLRVEEGAATDAAVDVSLPPDAWSDLVRLWRSAAALTIGGEVTVHAGTVLDLFTWEPVLRALYQGIPVYAPHGREVTDRQGRVVDPSRDVTLGDPDADLAAFFEATGVMRVRGVFGAAEVAALDAEVDRLAALARPDDDRSWWAEGEDGSPVLCRLVYAGEHSPAIAALASDPRVVRLASLLHDDLAPTTDRMEGIAVLLKPPGRLKGLANIPWHTDCGLGGHHIMCPTVAIGIQLTGSTPETGCLEAIAGSHGMTCPTPGPGDLERMPYVSLPTEPGDVTVHIADVLHASPAPTGVGGRRTIYVTFQPPALFENVGPGQAFNDLIRSRTAAQLEGGLGR